MSSGGEKETKKRDCLILVEADGLFDGRRRVRLPLPLPSMPGSSLLDLKEGLINALELSQTTNAADVELSLYDTTNQSFRKLTRTNEIPPSCCRIRITVDTSTKTIPKQPMDGKHNNNVNGCRTQELLALPWREFSSSIDHDGRLVLKGGKHSIVIREVSNSGLGTGTNIWDGAIALAKFLEFHDNDNNNDDDHCDNAKKPDDGTNRPTIPQSKDVDSTPHDAPDDLYSVRGKRVLELGAGTGLVGIAAHVAFGAREVVLTDLEYSLDNLRKNMIANACNNNHGDGVGADGRTAASSTLTRTIDACMLDWFDLQTCDVVLERPAPGTTAPTAWYPTIVLAADVVWVESLVRPLVQTLHHICTKALPSPPPPPLILLSYQRRSQAVEDLLFRSLEDHSFRTEDVTSPMVSTTTGVESKIRIYRITYAPRVD